MESRGNWSHEHASYNSRICASRRLNRLDVVWSGCAVPVLGAAAHHVLATFNRHLEAGSDWGKREIPGHLAPLLQVRSRQPPLLPARLLRRRQSEPGPIIHARAFRPRPCTEAQPALLRPPCHSLGQRLLRRFLPRPRSTASGCWHLHVQLGSRVQAETPPARQGTALYRNGTIVSGANVCDVRSQAATNISETDDQSTRDRNIFPCSISHQPTSLLFAWFCHESDDRSVS